MASRRNIISVVESSRDQLIFNLENADPSIANALRRVMIAEVPTLAIDNVRIYENTTVASDEFLAHRLGLFPLDSSNVKDLRTKEECDCDSWCERCSVKFELDVVCHEEERTIFAHDLIGTSGDGPSFVDNDTVLDGLVDASERGLVLVHMKRGQVLRFEAIAVKGVGKLHAKWSPVSTVTFQYLPSITLNYPLLAEFTDQEKRDWIRTCPVHVFNITDHDVSVVHPDACMYCDECVKEGKFILAAKRKLDPLEKPVAAITQRRNPETGGYDFKFTVETTGVMEPEKIVRSALNVLHHKLSIIRDAYDELKRSLELP